jgi:hypothetical protein
VGFKGTKWGKQTSSSLFEKSVLCSVIPDLLLLRASMIWDHHENAREMLRCDRINIVKHLLSMNKKSDMTNACSPLSSLMAALSTFPTLWTG